MLIEQAVEISANFYNDIKTIISESKIAAVRSVNFQRVLMYWRLGERIFVEEQRGEERARQFYRAYLKASALRTQFNWLQY